MRPKMEPHGQTRGPFKLPVFAFSYDAVIRLSLDATSQPSTTIVLSIHPRARLVDELKSSRPWFSAKADKLHIVLLHVI